MTDIPLSAEGRLKRGCCWDRSMSDAEFDRLIAEIRAAERERIHQMLAELSEVEVHELAWTAVCSHHCHLITCDGPITDGMQCARSVEITAAILRASAALLAAEGGG